MKVVTWNEETERHGADVVGTFVTFRSRPGKMIPNYIILFTILTVVARMSCFLFSISPGGPFRLGPPHPIPPPIKDPFHPSPLPPHPTTHTLHPRLTLVTPPLSYVPISVSGHDRSHKSPGDTVATDAIEAMQKTSAAFSGLAASSLRGLNPNCTLMNPKIA